MTMSLQTPDVASVWGPSGAAAGDSETWRLPRSCLTLQPDSAFVCESTQFLWAGRQWDRGGTAKRGNSHDSRLQARQLNF